jgi:radical SAM protein with 4Fe4S-binding SPASM domain
MNTIAFIPEVVIWEITFACNMRCIHCGTSAGKRRPDELTTREALDLIDELAALGAKAFTLSGGEPLMRPDWLEMAERVRHHNLSLYLISNGYAMTEEDIRDFIRIGFNKVGISFDGTEKTHNYIRQRPDSYTRALRAMVMMKEQGQSFCAISQISNLNLPEMDEIRDILIGIGCPEWRVQMTTSTGRMQKDLVLSIDNFPKLVDKILQYQQDNTIHIDVGENIGYYGCKGSELLKGDPYFGCYAGVRTVGIESNGNVKGCLSMQPQFVEGNIRESSFTEIWNNPDGFAYNRKFTKETASGACHDCRYLPLCRGGCATTSVSASGCRADNPYCIYRIESAQGIEPRDSELVRHFLDQFTETPVEG